jgi:hypothetical protein
LSATLPDIEAQEIVFGLNSTARSTLTDKLVEVFSIANPARRDAEESTIQLLFKTHQFGPLKILPERGDTAVVSAEVY